MSNWPQPPVDPSELGEGWVWEWGSYRYTPTRRVIERDKDGGWQVSWRHKHKEWHDHPVSFPDPISARVAADLLNWGAE